MTRWFTLTGRHTYTWKSKISGKFYQFDGQKLVAVDHEYDQRRFKADQAKFVEVDERGNILTDDGQAVSRSAFSRQGMVKQPKTYTKMVKPVSDSVLMPKAAPPKPAAPRTVVSSKKSDDATPKVEAPIEPEPPAQEEVEAVADVVNTDAISEPVKSEDSVPKKAKRGKRGKRGKRAKKAEKLGRNSDE